ncbi:Crp/Fnr family transcriptional regulator [Listeria rocourtiae]|uniref:Crp/Fnr family transcriptional regulator n=1 Tax=Listeria rocourtiae TaxID=647910 RepID=UPI001628B602|nr:helix-turn-helix domain-containing protein [Listeria rocourtiae]MBC1605518.1 Crp/Fnr family transcriptional regulator [Listeria rocourtiae]
MGSLEKTNGVEMKYSKNDIISKTDVAFVIESGYVAVLNADGDIMDFIGIGSGILSLDALSSYSFEVISNELLVIQYEQDTVLSNEKDFIVPKKNNLLKFSSEQRISQTLFQLGRRHGTETGDPGLIRFPKAINKGSIAKYTNLNPNTVTKALKKLQSEGVIYNRSRELFIDMFEMESRIERIAQ